MERVDCLFIHVPKSRNDRPIDQFIGINFLPMGLLGLADLLQRDGVSTEIVHTGVERIENHDFSFRHYIRERVPRIVAVDLHWHHQSFDAIETAKQVKAELPSVYVLLGGFTASFFHEEIMRNFDVVDGILRGEAEGPILELTRVLLEGTGDLFSVPNLTWRRKGRVLVNPLSYVASEKDLNSLSFTNFPLLKNYRTYIHYLGQPLDAKSASKERNFRSGSLESPTYHLTVGRGCPVQCTWCSGNIPSQETVTGRREVIFRGVEQVLQSIREAISYGYENFHISFDPYPQRPEYFLDLFSRIRQEKIQTECFFESFGLPTIDLIKSFGETFPGPKSLIALSPDVGSDPVRKMHKGNAYTNQDLMDCLDQLKKREVFCDLFFTLGVPFEKEEDVCQTVRLQREVRNRYPNVRAIHTYTAQMEPGSPWHLDPESFRVKTSLKNFLDFYHYHSGEESPSSSMGYWIPGYFQGVEDEIGFEERLQDILCRSFRSINPNAGKSRKPFGGSRFCDLSNVFRKMKRLAKEKM